MTKLNWHQIILIGSFGMLLVILILLPSQFKKVAGAQIDPDQPVTIEFHIKKDHQNNFQAIQVRVGQEVIIKADSEVPATIHILGYDILQKLTANTPVEFGFKADKAGRFGIERQKSGVQLGVLQVDP